VAPWWEPYELRGSSTVLREARGETPRACWIAGTGHKEVCQKLNRKLQGWRQYFSVGATSKAYQAVDDYVYDRVRNFLRRRHKVSSQGTRQFPAERVYGTLGVISAPGTTGRAYVSLR